MKCLEELNYQNAITFDDKEINYKKNKNVPNKYSLKILISYIQIFSSLIILASTFTLKQINSPIFINFKNFYNSKINSPIFENFDFKKSVEDIYEKISNKFHKKTILKNQDNDVLKDDQSILLTVPVSKPLDEGSITSRFGLRKDPFTFKDKQHSGLDIGANGGEIIHAILPGTVVKAERLGSFGNCVILDHGNNIQSLYAHCDKILVTEGTFISRGQDLASVGSSGRSTGNHLHLEISVNGIKQNPENFLENAYV